MLADYFADRLQAAKALDAYHRFALPTNGSRSWDIGGHLGKIHLYSLGETAFSPATDRSSAVLAFAEVHGVVRTWVSRSGGPFAPPEEVFDALCRSSCSLAFAAGVSLANFTWPSPESQAVESLLPCLWLIKRNKTYPITPVAKILHFMNPGLFPIYDDGVIWRMVMSGRAPFSNEYRAFCRSKGFQICENSARFNLQYTLWAAGYIQGSDSSFMDWFAEWMTSNYREDIERYCIQGSIRRLYATAFEFVAIGATLIEMGGR
jgi:hypothetical protein